MNNFNSAHILFIIFLLGVSLLFNIYFITVFFAGVVFMSFITCIKQAYYYKLILTVIFFITIETIHGLQPLSLTAISLITYYLVIPRIKHIFSASTIADMSFLLSFYILFYLYIQFINRYDLDIELVFLVNFIIDSLIIGFLI